MKTKQKQKQKQINKNINDAYIWFFSKTFLLVIIIVFVFVKVRFVCNSSFFNYPFTFFYIYPLFDGFSCFCYPQKTNICSRPKNNNNHHP